MRQLPCSRRLVLAVAWLAVCGSTETVSTAQAQMVTGTAGLRSVRSRFYERNGVSFGFGFGGSGRARCVGGFGSPLGLSPFGGLGGWMNGGLRSGWSVRGGSATGHFGFYSYQGSQRSLVSTQSVVTGLPGYPMLILSLILISEPTRLGMIAYGVFCLKR